MADYRSVQTRMWREDEWFQELDVEARLLWIYLFTNPSASPAGIYRLPLRTIAFESGVSYEAAQRLILQFSDDGKAYYEDGVLWVVNMRRLQFPGLIDGSKEWQTATRISRDIDLIPDRCPLKTRYLAHSGYPIVYEVIENGKTSKRVSIQYPDGDNSLSIPHATGIDTQSVNSNITVTETQPNETQQNAMAAAVEAWHAGGLTVNKAIADDLRELIGYWEAKGYPWYVADAITEATRQGKLTLENVQGILRGCEREGRAPSNKARKNGSDPSPFPSPVVGGKLRMVYEDGTIEEVEAMTNG